MINVEINNRKKLLGLSAGIYLLSRLVFHLIGIQFLSTFDYMFWLDTDLLQHKLGESLWYAHAFPPGMNALAGLVLKISPEHSESLLKGFYLMTGMLFCISFTYLLDAFLSVNKWLIVGIVTFFHLSPPFIYFENYLYYTFPSSFLLCVLTVLFYQAIRHKSFKWWFAFFTICVLLGLLRATFHLVWVMMILGMVLIFEKKRARILKAFAAPFSLLLFFYLKNLLIFGFFGVSSWGGFNLSLNTINRIPLEERQAMATRGELSPIYAFHPYSAPSAYASLYDLSQGWDIPCLDQEIRSVGRPNYNHWIYLKVSPLRMEDSWQYIREHPRSYFRNIWFNTKQFLEPTTHWHPREPGFSPHAVNREKIRGYESIYNTVLHGSPQSGTGLYVLFPFLLLFWGAYSGIRLLKNKFAGSLMDKWLFFICFNSLFVYLASICLTFGEMARYRFLIEPYVILLFAYTITKGIEWLRNRTKKQSF